MNATDRDCIVEMLLEDPPPSCRAVSRATGYSDWTIRKIARELDGDPRPMRQRLSRPQEPVEEAPAFTGWLVFGGVIGFFALAIWAARRSVPPLDSGDYYTDFHTSPTMERRHDETQFPE